MVYFTYVKGNNFIMDDYNDVIQYNCPDLYKPEHKMVCFEDLTLNIPLNYERLKVLYKNSLHLLYIQFRFSINFKDKIEIFGWYNHPLFDSNKKFNTGEFKVNLFKPPIIDRDFHLHVPEKLD